jgi:N-acetylneuraminic acid mutarotase
MKIILSRLICFFVIFYLPHASAQWLQVADFGGLERDDLVTFTCNDKAFAGSGMQVGYQVTNDFYEYKADLNQWQAIANLPGLPRQYAFSFSFNDVGFVFAGIDQAGDDLKDGYAYHPQNNSWTIATAYPGSGSRGCASSTFANFGYAGLGRSGGNTMHNDWWQYHSANNSWIQKTSFPGTARNLSACFESNGFIYIVGGIDANDIALDDIWQYNPVNDEWLLVATVLSTAVGNAAHCKVKHSGVLLGGFDGQNLYTNNALQFDAFNSVWMTIPPIPINGAIKGAKAFSINNILYVTCGITANNTRLRSTWKYDMINALEDPNFDGQACNIFPNPAKEKLNIMLPKNKIHLFKKYEICDLNGFIVKASTINNLDQNITIETNDLTAGFYLVKIYNLSAIKIHKLLIIK